MGNCNISCPKSQAQVAEWKNINFLNNINRILVILIQRWDTKVKKKLEKAQIELRTTKIKNDTLVQINDRQYTKLVADTLTEKQLRKKIDSFGVTINKDGQDRYYQVYGSSSEKFIQ